MAGWRLEITLPKSIYEEIGVIAEKKKVSKSALITEILEQYLNSNKDDTKAKAKH